MTERKPIFFAWTRSFWASLVGLVILFFGAPQEVLNSIGFMLGYILPWDGEVIGHHLVQVAPGILWLFALQQRSHAARPYSLNPKDIE